MWNRNRLQGNQLDYTIKTGKTKNCSQNLRLSIKAKKNPTKQNPKTPEAWQKWFCLIWNKWLIVFKTQMYLSELDYHKSITWICDYMITNIWSDWKWHVGTYRGDNLLFLLLPICGCLHTRQKAGIFCLRKRTMSQHSRFHNRFSLYVCLINNTIVIHSIY